MEPIIFDPVSVIIGCIVVIPLTLMAIEVLWRRLRSSKSVKGTHIIVVGGSTGIGRSLAIQAAANQARAITLIARSLDKLRSAEDAIVLTNSDCKTKLISADVTNFADISKAIDDAVQANGAPDYLVCSAGASYPGYFLEQSLDVFKKAMELNYLGTVACVKAAVPHMAKAKSGHCILVSSGAGISGWLGYTTYSPTKFAVRGLGEALRNELKGFNIKVSVAYPPDTQTPGFDEENKSKPVETVEMLMPSVHSPDTVASYIWYSVGKGDFNCSCPDILQDFLVALMSGVTPRRLYILDVLIHPVVVLLTSAFRWNSDRIACQYPKRLNSKNASRINGRVIKSVIAAS